LKSGSALSSPVLPDDRETMVRRLQDPFPFLVSESTLITSVSQLRRICTLLLILYHLPLRRPRVIGRSVTKSGDSAIPFRKTANIDAISRIVLAGSRQDAGDLVSEVEEEFSEALPP